MSDIKVEDVLEAYNGLIGNWDITSIISEIKNSWDREAMTDLFRISASLITTIESQKEEIAELREREYNEYPRIILELETRIFKLQDDANTQEAITELAVKENENLKAQLKNAEAKEFAYDNLRKRFDLAVKELKSIIKAETFADYGTAVSLAKVTLFEIERLQNEQT